MDELLCKQYHKEFASLKENEALLQAELLKSQKEYNREAMKEIKEKIKNGIEYEKMYQQFLWLGRPKDLKEAGKNINSLEASILSKVINLNLAVVGLDMASAVGDEALLKKRLAENDQKKIAEDIGRLPLVCWYLSLTLDYERDFLKDFPDEWFDLPRAFFDANDNLQAALDELTLIGKEQVPPVFEEIIKAIQKNDSLRLIEIYKSGNFRDRISEIINNLDEVVNCLAASKKPEPTER